MRKKKLAKQHWKYQLNDILGTSTSKYSTQSKSSILLCNYEK